jgi:Cof subfamily protein (haloacid dehalogenase superfamily)
MAAYRMIAIDLDGTLLGPDGTVSPRAKAAVHSALRAGLLVCFATGRNFTESQMVLDAVEHYDTAVFVGGAMVIDTRHRKTLHRMGMQPQLAREVCELFESLGHAALALQDTAAAGVDYLATDDVKLDEATSQWMRVTAAKIERFSRLARHSHEHTIRVGIVASAKEIARVRRMVLEKFGERVVCQSLFVPSYDVEVLEVFDPSVNKWEGISQVARMHGIGPEQIVAIGDDVNDLTMIASAGLGVAMGNARPEVAAVAKRVIGRNDQDGLAVFLEELVASHAVEPESEGELVRE